MWIEIKFVQSFAASTAKMSEQLKTLHILQESKFFLSLDIDINTHCTDYLLNLEIYPTSW